MTLFWSAVFLLLCHTIMECECDEHKEPTENADYVKKRTTDTFPKPAEFRCYKHPLTEFDDFEDKDYVALGYAFEGERIGCMRFKHTQIVYPPLAGTDPMMPFYIRTMHKGFVITDEVWILRRPTTLQRTKEYCASGRLMAPAFLDYWERFHGDSESCMKIMEYIRRCMVFRQIREMYATKLYEKLCLDEDGCYNVMKFYDGDLPYCVKYTAINEYKNSSAGSWHHSIINYCKLTDMVPEAKSSKYDTSILSKKGRTKENLREMCLYLRYRLLPEEANEQEIPDDAIDTFDTETTTGIESQNGVSYLLTSLYWTPFSMLLNVVVA